MYEIVLSTQCMVYLTIFYDQSQCRTVFCKKCSMVFNHLTVKKNMLILIMEFVFKIKLCMLMWSDMDLLLYKKYEERILYNYHKISKSSILKYNTIINILTTRVNLSY